MADPLPFWRLGHLTDAELYERARAALNGSRRLTAELVAHLGEVEERRLHLRAACGSMFEYCVLRLGLSEDEACRRLEAARLARRFPALFPLLASGALSLTALSLLKPHLTEGNCAELLASVCGKSLRRTREVLAARFPRPDVPSSVRKVPQRHASAANDDFSPRADESADGDALRAAAHRSPPGTRHAQPRSPPGPTHEQPSATEPARERSGAVPPREQHRSDTVSPPRPPSASPPDEQRTVAATPAPAQPPKPSATVGKAAQRQVEPIAAERFVIRFTASGQLKRKLELARDLSRHRHPDGDFAPIIERALDLLLRELLRQRFGFTNARRKPATGSPAAANDSATSTVEPHSASGAPRSGAAHGPSAGDQSNEKQPTPPDGETESNDFASPATSPRASADARGATTATGADREAFDATTGARAATDPLYRTTRANTGAHEPGTAPTGGAQAHLTPSATANDTAVASAGRSNPQRNLESSAAPEARNGRHLSQRLRREVAGACRAGYQS